MYHQIRHRNFFESAQKFFEPCLSNRLILWKGIFVAFIWGINGIAHVIFLERLTYYLLNQPGNFATVLELYVAYLLIYEVVNFSVRKW